MRRVCVITGTRAEYGLLRPLISRISDDPELKLQLIACGAHLSDEFGRTIDEIEFSVDKCVEVMPSEDDDISVAKAMGRGMVSFADAYGELRPDLIVVLGDRYEIMSAVCVALVMRIPVAHIHGGETTEGAFDEAIRHSITKMSHLHFVSTEEYLNRIVQLGEKPETVHNVGALGVENIRKLHLMNRGEFEESISFKLKEQNLIVTFHPVTLEEADSTEQFSELLKSLDQLEGTGLIFTKANSDAGGRKINSMIDEYVSLNSEKAVGFESLGLLRYLSAVKLTDGVVGNSSSGIIEAPALRTGTVNIGDRQKGRIRCDSIIDCEPDSESISEAIEALFSPEFKTKLGAMSDIYGDGDTSRKILEIIKNTDLSNILKKSFYNIPIA